jgi:Tol biopolymer transport system component
MTLRKFIGTIAFITLTLAGLSLIYPGTRSFHLVNTNRRMDINGQRPKTRMVWATHHRIDYGAVSPDGRNFAFTGYSGILYLHEIGSRKIRVLKEPRSAQEAFSENFEDLRWSRDSRHLVYVCHVYEGDEEEFIEYNELRIIRIEDSESRPLYRIEEEIISPLDWSPDGKHIICSIDFDRLILVSVEDGSIYPLKTSKDNFSIGNAFFSPNGRYIAYEQGGIFIYSINDHQETRLALNPINYQLLGWSPDGKRIYSSFGKDWLAFSVPQGKRQLIARFPQRHWYDSPLGFTQDGKFYFLRNGDQYFRGYRDTHILKLNPESGGIVTREKLTLSDKIFNIPPVWSPDGKYLVYMTMKLPWPFQHALCSQSTKTDEVHRISFNRPFMFKAWFPDGKNILAYVENEGVSKINIHSGEIVPILDAGKDRDINDLFISPDSRFLFYVKTDKHTILGHLMRRELETGEETEIFQTNYLRIALSNNGKYLAIVTYPNEAAELKRPSQMSLMPSSGGNLQDIYFLDEKNRIICDMKWSPDDRHIYFSKIWAPENHMEAVGSIYGGGPRFSLWRIPSDGGAAQDLETSYDDLFSIHPDGCQILYSEYEGGLSTTELWVLEDIFPKDIK